MQDDAFITCLRCGAKNSLDVRYCDHCGDRLERICGHCGHDNPLEAKYYCENCEQPLVVASSESPPESSATSEPTPEPVEPPEPSSPEPTSEQSSPEPVTGIGVCPRCQHSNEPDSSYCYHCGLPLDDERARSATLTAAAYKQGAPAGFWVRLVAFIIDSIFLNIVYMIIYWTFGEDITRVLNAEPPYVLADLAVIIFALIYAPLLISLWSTTVGKQPFEMYVVKVDGGRCSFWRAFGRELAKILSYLLLFIGILMIAFRSDKRGLHDLIAGTAVIKR